MPKKNSIVASVHQPNILPWVGFFYKIAKSDIFVYLDNVQFIKRSIINRVKIKTMSGEKWITVPVKTKGRYLQKINKVEIDNSIDWRKKLLGSLSSNYSRSRFFDEYYPNLQKIILKDFGYLIDLNIEFIEWILNELSIKTKLYKSSELINDTKDPTERIISICNKVGADMYLSGFGGQKYQGEISFEKHKIGLVIYDFEHPVYKQLWDDFIPGLSVLDFLFNNDKETVRGFFLN